MLFLCGLSLKCVTDSVNMCGVCENRRLDLRLSQLSAAH